jgi:hypothetical protein
VDAAKSNGKSDTLVQETPIEGAKSSFTIMNAFYLSKKPFVMGGLFLLGVILATVHHLYYGALDQKVAGSPSRQQWAVRFGAAFAFSAIASFKTAVGMAYIQLLWVVLRKKALRIRDIDALFALTSDLSALWTRGIWTTAILVVPIAVVAM